MVATLPCSQGVEENLANHGYDVRTLWKQISIGTDFNKSTANHNYNRNFCLLKIYTLVIMHFLSRAGCVLLLSPSHFQNRSLVRVVGFSTVYVLPDFHV